MSQSLSFAVPRHQMGYSAEAVASDASIAPSIVVGPGRQPLTLPGRESWSGQSSTCFYPVIV
jgi:hypothetical protein